MRLTLAAVVIFIASTASALPEAAACGSTTSTKSPCNKVTTSTSRAKCKSPSTSTSQTTKASSALSTNSMVPMTSSTVSTGGKKKSCKEVYDSCKAKANADRPLCASQYTQCLGYNPFSNKTSTGTGGYEYVTRVATKYVTYCPSPTTLTYQNQTYTVTAPTSLTITNCPCTITSPISSLAPASVRPAMLSSPRSVPVSPPVTSPNNVPTTPTSTQSAVTYTGGAERVRLGGALILGAVGLLAL